MVVSSGPSRLGATGAQADAGGSQHPADDAPADTKFGGQYPQRRAGLVAPDKLTYLLRWQALAVWQWGIGAWRGLLATSGWLPQQSDQAFLEAGEVREMLS